MSRRIGIITNDRHQVFQREVISGVEMVAHQQDTVVLIDSIEEERGNPRPVSLPLYELDGIVVISNVLQDDALRELAAIGKPVTLVSHRVPGVMLPSIIQNNAYGIQRLVDHLVHDCSRRTLVYIQGDMTQYDGIQRDRYFHASMLRHDLIVPPEYCLRGDFFPEIASQSLQEFINSRLPFDAVLAADHLMALRLFDVLRAAGLRVPEDVCLVGFGDGADAELAGLTTVGVDVIELGKRAARQLFVQMNGQPIAGVTWLNNQLVERSSTMRHKPGKARSRS